MSEAPFFPLPFRLNAMVITGVGLGLIVSSGARGPGSVAGFALFCLGMAGLDAVHRGRFGYRQAALFLGSLGVGLGLWAAAATALLVLLELPVPPELRTLLVVSAACAAGSVGSVLLSVRAAELRTVKRVRAVGRRVWRAASRLGGPRPDPRFGAGQPWRRVGPVRGG